MKIEEITVINMSIFNILNIKKELDCEIDENMTIGKNNQNKYSYSNSNYNEKYT